MLLPLFQYPFIIPSLTPGCSSHDRAGIHSGYLGTCRWGPWHRGLQRGSCSHSGARLENWHTGHRHQSPERERVGQDQHHMPSKSAPTTRFPPACLYLSKTLNFGHSGPSLPQRPRRCYCTEPLHVALPSMGWHSGWQEKHSASRANSRGSLGGGRG